MKHTFDARHTRRSAALAVMVFFVTSVSHAQPKPQGERTEDVTGETNRALDFPFSNEEAIYRVQIRGQVAINARVRIGDVRRSKASWYVPMSAVAKSTGLFHSLFPVDDRANTFIHPTSIKPLRTEKLFKEGGKERAYKVDYAHSLYRAKVDKRSRNPDKPERQRKFTKSIPGTTHDALSWLVHVRTRDDLRVGATFSYYIYDGWKLSRLDANVVGVEDVYTPMGWHRTWRIDLSREILNSRKNKKTGAPVLAVRTPAKPTGSLWLSQDDRRLPVKITMNSLHGMGEVVLVKYTKAP